MKNYYIAKSYTGHRKTRTAKCEYYIHKDGMELYYCRGGKVSFTNHKKAEEFAENFDEETELKNRYEWVRISYGW